MVAAPNQAKNISVAAGLYLVATPIGNLRDITLRAIDVLQGVSTIYAEDTRTSAKLLNAHAISTHMSSYHEHNAARMRPKLLSELEQGMAIALISDAGTPLISDPGYKLVQEAAAAGYPVIPIPGACALTTAACASGLPTDHLHFAGFLSAKQLARQKQLRSLSTIDATAILYESPKRLVATLRDIAAIYGDKHSCVVARELTKRFEEFQRDTAQALVAHFTKTPPKGEIVILLSPPNTGPAELSPEELDAKLREARQTRSLKDTASAVSAATGLPKRAIYQRALELENLPKDG